MKIIRFKLFVWDGGHNWEDELLWVFGSHDEELSFLFIIIIFCKKNY
jgi:hypothetical protein